MVIEARNVSPMGAPYRTPLAAFGPGPFTQFPEFEQFLPFCEGAFSEGASSSEDVCEGPPGNITTGGWVGNSLTNGDLQRETLYLDFVNEVPAPRWFVFNDLTLADMTGIVMHETNNPGSTPGPFCISNTWPQGYWRLVYYRQFIGAIAQRWRYEFWHWFLDTGQPLSSHPYQGKQQSTHDPADGRIWGYFVFDASPPAPNWPQQLDIILDKSDQPTGDRFYTLRAFAHAPFITVQTGLAWMQVVSPALLLIFQNWQAQPNGTYPVTMTIANPWGSVQRSFNVIVRD